MSSTASHQPREDAPDARQRRGALLAALVLASAYALPLFFPPGTSTVAPPPPDASLLMRLFPGVPEWWVLSRLSCLAAAMALAAMALVSGFGPFSDARDAGPTGTNVRDVGAAWSWAALTVAAVSAVASAWAGELGRGGQLGYVALLVAPALLLMVGTQRSARIARASTARFGVATAVVVAGWFLVRLLALWHSGRAADLVDGWDGLQCLERAARDDFNVVTGACYQGYTALPLVLQGAGVLGRWLPLGLQFVQVVHLLWLAVCAACMAVAGAAVAGAAAAPVVAAVFLFAPLTLMAPLWTAGTFVFPVLLALLLVLALRVERVDSPAAMAALGALAGVASRCPPLMPVLPVLAARILWRWCDGVRVPRAALVCAVLSFWAAWGPSLHEAVRLGDAVSNYTRGGGSWAVMEAALFGRFSPQYAEEAIGAATAHAANVPLGLMLSPFATPRTAVRLWGDTMLDPLGAALAALGLAVALRAVASRSEARLLVGVLAATLLPGIVSSYDRPSLSRVCAVAVPLALLAGAAFEALRAALLSRRSALVVAVTVAGAVGASGIVLFDVVNVRILPRSAVGIVLGAVDDGFDPAGAIVLDETLWKPRYTRPGAELVPKHPLRVEPVAALRDVIGNPATSVVFWSPGEEEDYAVSQTICRAWPGAALYALSDETRLTTVFAAGRKELGLRRAEPISCSAGVETEAVRVDRALAEAAALEQAGHGDQATAVLETQARQTFGQARIFDAAARALLAHAGGSEDIARAVEWASRACAATAGSNPLMCATLAAGHAANGRPEEAVRVARRAKEAALQRGDEDLANELERRIQQYARAASGVSG